MASPAPSTPVSKGTPNSKLDNASKEDLIKLLKKQQLLIKKTNADNETEKQGLKKDIHHLTQDNESLRSKVSQLAVENEQMYQSNQKQSKDLQLLEDSISEDNEIAKTQILTLEKKIAQLSSEREDFLSELVVLRDTRDQMRQVLMEIQDSEGQAKARLQDVERQMEVERGEREQENGELRKLVETLEHTLAETQSQLKEAEHSLSLKSELVQAKTDISSLREEGESLKSMIRDYNTQFSVETEALAAALSSLGGGVGSGGEEEGLKEQIREQEEQIDRLTHKLKQISVSDETSEHSRVPDGSLNEDGVQKELMELRERVGELEGAVERAEEEKRKMEDHLERAEEEKRKMKDHLDEFISESATLHEQEGSSGEREELWAALERRGEEVEALTAEKDFLRSELGRLQEQEGEGRSEREQLLHSLNLKQEEMEALLGEVEALRAEVGRREEERTQWDVEWTKSEEEWAKCQKEWEEEVTGMRTERDSATSQVFVLEEQVTQLRGEVEAERSRVVTLESSGKELGLVLVEREERIAELQSQVEGARAEIAGLMEDNQGSHSLISMELADYQRASDALQSKLNTSKAELEQARGALEKKESQLSKIAAEMRESEKQRLTQDDMIAKLKLLVKKAKKEAGERQGAEEEARREVEETRGELERSVQQLEGTKLELASTQGQLERTVETHRRTAAEKGAVVKSLENRMHELKADAESERGLREEVSREFEAYKVRVHSVLKQQKTGDTAAVSQAEHEAIVAQLSLECEGLRTELAAARETVGHVISQRDSAEGEVRAVTGSLESAARQNNDRERFYLERITELEETLRSREDDVIKGRESAAAQRSALTESYTRTIEQSQASHTETIQILQDKIERLEGELQKRPLSAGEVAMTTSEIAPPVDCSTPAPKVRLGAEGSESPAPSVSALEEVLNNSALSRSNSRFSLSEGAQKEDDITQSKMAHLSTLLRESEHNAAALQEQCMVLKTEVRRLEKMIGRDNTNVEYLKNILLKYVGSSDAGARERLVPVLATVLQLTKEEVAVLTESAASGKREAVPWTGSWFSS